MKQAGKQNKMLLVRVEEIVGAVRIARPTCFVFGAAWDYRFKPLKDVTLRDLQQFQQKLTDPATHTNYGLSSVSQQDQAAMKELGISAPLGGYGENGFPNGSGLPERQSIGRIVEVLKEVEAQCSKSGCKVSEDTKLGTLAELYIKEVHIDQSTPKGPAQIGGGGTRPLELTQTERTATNDNKGLSNG